MQAERTSTEEQLREARLRIAVLEKELLSLRSCTEPTSLQTNELNTFTSPMESLCQDMTTKPTSAAYSEVSRDQSQLSVSCLDVPSPLALESTALTSSPPSTNVSPTLSDCPASELANVPSLTPAADVKPSTPRPAPLPTTPVTPATPTVRTPPPTDKEDKAPTNPAGEKPTPESGRVTKPQTAKRRPPTLAVCKTTTTKKDRTSLVAKCPEPRPGQTRYWTDEEHERFLEAIAEYGEKAYVHISNYVETRTPKQVRTHAQKFQMKMARLARQSLEAGQPIRMPPGMCPVIEVPVGSKSTIVPITAEESAKLCAQGGGMEGALDATMVSGLSSCLHAKRRGGKTEKSGKNGKNVKKCRVEEGDEKRRKSEDESCASGSGCADYMEVVKEELELEEGSFEEKLCEGFGSGRDESGAGESACADLLMSDRSASECGDGSGGSSAEDDDLEDLEKLEDDICLTPFADASDESWLLPDSSPDAL